MTDEKIIEALEYCASPFIRCKFCPLVNVDYCERELIEKCFDLANHQKEEIEKLKIDLEAMRGAANSYKMHYEKAKEELDRIEDEHKYLKKELDKHDPFYFCSIGGCEGASNTCWKDCADSMYNVTRIEAIKEFAERLKKAFIKCDPMFNRHIDKIVKEMVGDNNAKVL